MSRLYRVTIQNHSVEGSDPTELAKVNSSAEAEAIFEVWAEKIEEQRANATSSDNLELSMSLVYDAL